MNENLSDRIQESILKHLFTIHQKDRGIKSTSTSMRDLKEALKIQGYKENEIVSNLDYLTQTEWVVKEKEEYPSRRGNATINVKNVTYKISEKGINYFQVTSKFQSVH